MLAEGKRWPQIHGPEFLQSISIQLTFILSPTVHFGVFYGTPPPPYAITESFGRCLLRRAASIIE
jgi:hypothetical protein